MADTKTELKTIVSAEVRDFVQGMRKAERESREFSQSVRQTSSMASKSSSVLNSAMVPALAAVAAGAIAAKMALGAMTAALKKSVSLAADAETMMVSFEVLLGSTKQAQTLLADINAFAASTPLQTADLNASAKMLIAFGEDVEEIIPTLKRLGDISSGVGMPITELAEIYGKARVQQTLFAEDINQLTGRGIPVFDAFGEVMGKPASEIKKLASEGKVTFDVLEQAFKNLTSEGGQFGGMMQRQSQTFNGIMSTMRDNVDMVFRDVGKVIIEEFDLGTLVTQMTDFLKDHKDEIVKFVRDVARGLKTYWADFADTAASSIGRVLFVFNKLYDSLTVFFELLGSISTQMSKLAGSAERLFRMTGRKAQAGHMNLLQERFGDVGENIRRTAANRRSIAQGTDKTARALIKMGDTGKLGDFFRNMGGGAGLDPIEKGFDQKAFMSQLTKSFGTFSSFGQAIAKTPAPMSRKDSLMGSLSTFSMFGEAFAKSIADKASTMDLATRATPGSNTAILAGTSGAVSLENERARAQVDVSKKQLNELEMIRLGIENLASKLGSKPRITDSLAGLF